MDATAWSSPGRLGRRAGAALALGTALWLLAGCGGGAAPVAGTPNETQVPGPAPAPAPAPSPPPAAITLPGWPAPLPAGFPAPEVPADNPVTVPKAELGRHLFHDDRLSGNGQQSCATCHQQSLGFGQARRTPFGSTGQTLPRNSPPLANLAWMSALTWGDATPMTLEQQMRTPLFATAPVEMGVNDANRDAVLARIAGDPAYGPMFAEAFPGETAPVRWDNVIRAIATFQRTLVSGDSRWDRAERGELALEPAEARGRDLFFAPRAGCSACHGGVTFAQPTHADGVPVTTTHHNIGLYDVGGAGTYPAPNRGLFERTRDAADNGRFRTPSLRNVAVTGPYMHDGSVATLEEVIELYAAGGRHVTFGPLAGDGRNHPARSPLVGPLALSQQDRADLLAFLRALTDPGFLSDPRHSNPFAPR